ncbi:alpha/beta hydrolase fold domain-containing protein [Halovenus sp. WSH3]|uniref:Alpha/beta hydrolase fold domain-containing protein n=1 Tax=Halovenus carboxidivorans TaxID=2692199 RepID=A0A6B0SZ61_9EURY|nr:alpha/beta hydrolase [Halovenus carboxidivorans]MXR51108.1 alpha/beta hydrolase fold domain-containing protein [Halovenus carboxidivorans]
MSDRQLNPQTEALLETLGEGITPPTYTLSVPEGREMLDDLFEVTDPEAVGEVMDTEIQGPDGPIPLRIYAPEGSGPFPVLVFFHGGGWVRGSLDGYDGLCRRLANRSEAIVVSVDYRRAPEHPFPAGFEDCYAATEWAAEYAAELGGDPDRIAVGGDSAGGNLTAAVTLATRDRDGPDLDHQLLIYPATNSPLVQWFDSYDENESGYLLELDSVEWYLDQYVDDADHGNQYAFPLRARDLSGLPEATVITAGFDPIRDEGIAYADRLAEDGVDVEHMHYESQIHAFVSLYEHLDDGAEAIDRMGERLRSAFE